MVVLSCSGVYEKTNILFEKEKQIPRFIPQIENVYVEAGSWVDPHDAQWRHQYYTTPITCKGGACQNIWHVTICIAPFQQTRERKEGNQESYKISRNL